MCIQYQSIYICGFAQNLNLDICDNWPVCLAAGVDPPPPATNSNHPDTIAGNGTSSFNFAASFPTGNESGAFFPGTSISVHVGPIIKPMFLYARCGTCSYCLFHSPDEEIERTKNVNEQAWLTNRITETKRMLQHLGPLEKELEEKLEGTRIEKGAYQQRLGMLERVAASLAVQTTDDAHPGREDQSELAKADEDGKEVQINRMDWIEMAERSEMGDLNKELRRWRQEGGINDKNRWEDVKLKLATLARKRGETKH
ncbi:MAG: hypothetical protein MMC33_006431 [Icmadophila ericetorum]|nr:hypothetical protein [Icmadophila ericetorum]